MSSSGSHEMGIERIRGLANANPRRHLPDLAAALNDLSVRLAEVGRWSEALAPLEEAVQVYRRLADDRTVRLWDLATA